MAQQIDRSVSPYGSSLLPSVQRPGSPAISEILRPPSSRRRCIGKLGTSGCRILVCGFISGLLVAFSIVGIAFVALPGIFFGGGGSCPPPTLPSAPDPPFNLTVQQGLTSITMTWTPAANQSDAGVEYEVQSNRSGSMQSEGRNVCGGVTSFLLDGLPAGSAIALRLRALSALGGRGNWSEIVSTTTLAAMTPQAPTTAGEG